MARYRVGDYEPDESEFLEDDPIDVPFLCRDRLDQRGYVQTVPKGKGNSCGNGCDCHPVEESSEDDICPPQQMSQIPQMSQMSQMPQMSRSLVPYNSVQCGVPLKRSMSFLTHQELFSYRAIPALGVLAYLGTAVGTVAHHETYEHWFGSEHAAINVVNGLTFGSVLGIFCYMYGRRHIRHAGAFQGMIYPAAGSVFFNCASHFSWAFIKELLKDKNTFDHHWRCAIAMLAGCVFLYTGRSYLKYVDHW